MPNRRVRQREVKKRGGTTGAMAAKANLMAQDEGLTGAQKRRRRGQRQGFACCPTCGEPLKRQRRGVLVKCH